MRLTVADLQQRAKQGMLAARCDKRGVAHVVIVNNGVVIMTACDYDLKGSPHDLGPTLAEAPGRLLSCFVCNRLMKDAGLA